MLLTIIHQNHTCAHAYILIGIGLAIRYWVGRRRFNRRGIAGLQTFSSYERWWLTTRLEYLVNFLALLAILCSLFLLLFK